MDGQLHPELSAARWLPNLPLGPRWLRVTRSLMAMAVPRASHSMILEDRTIAGINTAPDIPITILRPRPRAASVPAILWIHGGGMVLGSQKQDLTRLQSWVDELEVVIVSVGYRLAPEARAPDILDDCYAAWEWMVRNAADLGIDIKKLVIAGESAGGGLAASTVHRIYDTNSSVQPIYQLLVFPMLDDRTVLKYDDSVKAYVWNPKSNRIGWTAYLGVQPGSLEVPSYSVPARRDDLSGLPPLWLGVGTLDLFYTENLEYVRRLREANVKVDLLVIPGAFHGFHAVFPKSSPAQEFMTSQVDALRDAFTS